jgi:hypothetical protein
MQSILMESLQMLKFTLKKAHLNFTGGWITLEHAMQEQVNDQDLLAALFSDESEDVMDQIIQDFAADSDSETTSWNIFVGSSSCCTFHRPLQGLNHMYFCLPITPNFTALISVASQYY